jgi:hypothetical protein
MKIQCSREESLLVNKLPDGSQVIVNPSNETMYALNATAGAAFDACRACQQATTLPEVAETMQRSLNVTVTEELAEMAVRQLHENKLVSAPEVQAKPTRRQIIGSLGAAAALPLVVSLTLADQKAYAQQSSSPAPVRTPPIPPRTPPPPPPPLRFPLL